MFQIRMCRSSVLACSAGVLLSASIARAQWSLDSFEPSAPGSTTLSGSNAEFEADSPVLRTLASYAHGPLVFRRSTGDAPEVERALSLHLQGTYAPSRYLGFDLGLPMLLQGGHGQAALGTPDPSGLALGDVRLGARLPVLFGAASGLAAAFSAQAWLPTGSAAQVAGTGQVRYGLSALFSGEAGELAWSAGVGRRRLANADSERKASELFGTHTSFFAGARVRSLRATQGWSFGPELFGAAPDHIAPSRRVSLELLLAGAVKRGPWSFTAAIGPGLTRGPGTPRFRVVLEVSFDLSEAERAATSPVAGFESRRLEPATELEFRLRPANTRRVSTHDMLAHSGAESELEPTSNPSNSVERADDCEVPDQADAAPESNNCALSVRLEEERIAVANPIRFTSGRDRFDPSSEQTLSAIAELLGAHPEIERVSVEGHTDDIGSKALNLALSRRRADAVVRWLIEHGVDSGRLESQGLGPESPLDPSPTAGARERNRRVEFRVLKTRPIAR
ncbi:MAG TPA: OmpA family protein [Polyangiaceae bacterium]|nr:OmpA family protein [Polyangiaceae bacterium]